MTVPLLVIKAPGAAEAKWPVRENVRLELRGYK